MRLPPASSPWLDEDTPALEKMFREVLKSGFLTLASKTEQFEQEFNAAQGLDSRGFRSVAVSSCSSGLHIAMQIVDMMSEWSQRKKAVVVATNTFYTDAGSVVLSGMTPCFADTAKNSLNVSLKTVSAAFYAAQDAGYDPVAVVVTHIGGQVVSDIADISKWCKEMGLILIEDCAHAHGCSGLDGDLLPAPAGSFGDMSVFSFYPTKVLTTGEGGTFCAKDEDVLAMAKCLRDHGKSDPKVNSHDSLGFNWRMTEQSACMGILQSRRLSEIRKERQAIAGFYENNVLFSLADYAEPWSIVSKNAVDSCSSWYKYVIMLHEGVVKDLGGSDRIRSSVRDKLRSDGLSLSGGVYDIPLHKQPVFEGLPCSFKACDQVDSVIDRHLCLPVVNGMDTALCGEVARTISGVLDSLC